MINKKLLISFVGSRGSGKTTVADEVANLITEQRDSKCVRQHKGLSKKPLIKGLLRALYLLRFFDYEMFKYFGLYGRKKNGFLPTAYQIFFPLALMSDLRRIAKSEVLLYDSNILRGLEAAASSGDIDTKRIKEIYERKISTHVDQVVIAVVQTEPEEAIKRWEQRDTVSLSSHQNSLEIKKRKNAKKTTDKVLQELATIPNVSIIYLDGALSPKENAALIVRAVEKACVI